MILIASWWRWRVIRMDPTKNAAFSAQRMAGKLSKKSCTKMRTLAALTYRSIP